MISPLRIPQLALFLSLASSALSAPLVPVPGANCGYDNYLPCDTPPIPPTCNNIGLAYAVQSHPYENQGVNFPDLSVPYFHSAIPVSGQFGTTRSIGLINNSPNTPVSIYHKQPTSTVKIGLNHRAYFVPPSSGDYTIAIKGSDDITFCWIGPQALGGNYNADNADITVGVGIGEGQKAWSFVKGVWYPFRCLLVNGVGPVAFGLKFTGPHGEDMLSGTEKDMPWFRSHSCDGAYPPFQPWGEETTS